MNTLAETRLPTQWGEFCMRAYQGPNSAQPHLVLYRKTWLPGQPVLVRMHSECMTGDVFSSTRCDCGEQLNRALELIYREGGALVYLRQEGRGIGLVNKMKAYNLQDEGLNTADANTHLGFAVDDRRYDLAIEMLQDLNITQIELLTNNPEKLSAFENSPIDIVTRRPLQITPQQENEFYLETKRKLMGHMLKK